MTFQQKNITVSLSSFALILGFFVIRLIQLGLNDNFSQTTVVRVWFIVIVLAIFGTLAAIITTHSASFRAAITNPEDPESEFDDLVDERDQRFDREGTHITYRVTSIGSFIAMLTFAFGMSPLIMFTLLIFFGLVAQIAGDVTRLRLYQEG